MWTIWCDNVIVFIPPSRWLLDWFLPSKLCTLFQTKEVSRHHWACGRFAWISCWLVKTDPGNKRCKFSFTVRDSPSDYIHITCWGSEGFISKVFESFKIYDVGERCHNLRAWARCSAVIQKASGWSSSGFVLCELWIHTLSVQSVTISHAYNVCQICNYIVQGLSQIETADT